jgi:N-acetylmuramoyl-L-alanine amidase
MKKVLITPLLLLILFSSGEAVKKTSVKKIRFASYKNHTRIVVDLTGSVEFTQNRLFNPDRLYFDLKECLLSKKSGSSLAINDKVLKSVRVAQYKKGQVRVVFDIKELDHFTAFMLENPHRLVVDVYAQMGDASRSSTKLEDKRYAIEKQLNKIKTIVIDPGHGGKDPGAIGPRGLKEKDITLSVAKRLGKILKSRYSANVIYTRSKDTFVPLNERTEVANSKRADLFISIHTNASRKRGARGVETYFLNWTNNREAMRVAARENKISIKKMEKMQNELQFILQDLARKNKNEESMRLAHSVQNSMISSLKKSYRKIENLGVKYAPFYVLVGAGMPSVLVEVSFISNREEEKRLASSRYKDKIAEAIAKGIDSYISQSTLIVQYVP